MKVKTSELTGKALDYAVALCECRREPELNSHYCTSWDISGPIIEREKLCITPDRSHVWLAITDSAEIVQFGPTPLIAAMRCYIASKLGDIVDIPDSLTQ